MNDFQIMGAKFKIAIFDLKSDMISRKENRREKRVSNVEKKRLLRERFCTKI